jgi:hypothetical protein
MENNWKKGMFLINPKAMQWGIGIVTEDPRGDMLKVFFEHECNIKKLGLKYTQPEEIADPGSAKLFLENAIVDEEIAAKSDRQPFPQILKQFLEDFPDGFQGKMLTHYELEYKWKAHDYCKQELSKDIWKIALENEEYENISTKIKRLYSKSNLLASFEMMNVGDAFKEPKGQKQLCTAFYNLLYGDGLFNDRFNETVKIFSLYKMDKWTTISYPLFIRFPKEYIFVKPMMTQKAAENRGFDILYTAQVNWGTYQRILEFSQDLFNRLSESDNEFLHPRDMIDIQSFMWCTYSKGWDDKEIGEAKREMGIF